VAVDGDGDQELYLFEVDPWTTTTTELLESDAKVIT
jgi:hypothetical protein